MKIVLMVDELFPVYYVGYEGLHKERDIPEELWLEYQEKLSSFSEVRDRIEFYLDNN